MRRVGKVFEQEELSLAEEFCISKAHPDGVVKNSSTKAYISKLV